MTGDDTTTVADLKRLVRAFAQARNWEPFHSPRNLGLALASEVGELLDHFRYRSDDQVAAGLADPSTQRAVAHELADCLWVLLRLAEVCDVDLADALVEKVGLAEHKYPIERAFGRNDKYDRLPGWSDPTP